MSAEIVLALAAVLAAGGALCDLLTRRLPNTLVLALALVAGSAAYLAGGWALLGSGALHALIALLAGMGLFALGAVGAGDAKFYTACAFAVPLARAPLMFGWMALAAFVLFVLLAAFHRGLKHRTPGPDGKRRSWSLPYGMPFAIGFIAATRPWQGWV